LFGTSVLRACASLLRNAIFNGRIAGLIYFAIDLYSGPNLLPRPNRYNYSALELFTEILASRIISNSHTICEPKLVRRNMQLTQRCVAAAQNTTQQSQTAQIQFKKQGLAPAQPSTRANVRQHFAVVANEPAYWP